MRIIARGRCTGKTTELILRSHVTGYPIVCPTLKQCEQVEKIAYNLHLWIPKPISLSSLESHCTAETPILLDNAEAIIKGELENYIGHKIDTISLTI